MKHDQPSPNVLTGHIGMFERAVPAHRWRASAWLALALLVAAVGMWELKMRSLGLRTEDIDDGKSYWAVERRKVDTGPRDQVVIVGDSRILFDTNLDEFQSVSGIRPIQLALEGTPARPFLHDLAEDERFTGLAVVGMHDGAFFRNQTGLFSAALAYARDESLAQRAGHVLELPLQRLFAFLDYNYALVPLIDEIDLPNRAGVDFNWDGYVYSGVWKLLEHFENRQAVMWQRLETDEKLRRHARDAWMLTVNTLRATGNDTPLPDAQVKAVIASTRQDIDKIRRRGGEVVLVRPPSAGPLIEFEHKVLPRDRVWDRLVRETNSVGIYFEDYPQMVGLESPEWSHLSGSAARQFTRAYVNVLCDKVSWLQEHGARCGDKTPLASLSGGSPAAPASP
jgi:hypothetical protein